MAECNGVCDNCNRTVCARGNPTLEPPPDELQLIAEETERRLRAEMNITDTERKQN